MTHINPSLSQVGFRGYADTGGENTNPKANENTNWSNLVNENFRIRFVVDETAGGAEANINLQLEYNHLAGGWNPVTSTSSVARTFASSQITDEGATTRILTSGTGTFVTGAFDEADGIAGSSNQIDFNSGGELTEVEYVLQLRGADVSDKETIQFRVVRSGGTLEAWTQTPTVTASAGATYNESGSGTATSGGSALPVEQGHNPTASGTATASGAATDTQGHVESGSGTGTFSGAVVPNLVLTETGSGTGVFSGAATDFISFDETGSGTAVTSGSATNQHTMVESGSGTGVFSGAALDTGSITETGSGTAASSGAATVGLSVSDTGSGTGVFSGAGSVVLVITITGSGSGVFSGAATDEHIQGGGATYNETGSGTALVAGTGADALADYINIVQLYGTLSLQMEVKLQATLGGGATPAWLTPGPILDSRFSGG